MLQRVPDHIAALVQTLTTATRQFTESRQPAMVA
jgi:hypothetical protein